MSAIYLDNRLVHYEVFGRRGQPIIFLHSWVGSWRYWVSVMDMVSERYRAFALDFWGFGDSDRNGGNFTLDDFVQMVYAFTEELGIQQAYLVGHGLGGMVAIRAAREYPDRFPRVVAVSTPLQGQVLEAVTRPSGLTRLLGGRSGPTETWSKLLRQIPIDDAEIQQDLYDDTDGLSAEIIQQIQESILQTDLSKTLPALHETPLLAVYGEKDQIVPPEHALFLNDETERPHQLLVMPKANHFLFLEHTSTFGRLVLDFMVSEGSPVEIKEQWRRRVSQREYL